MSKMLQTRSPIDGSIYVERPWASSTEIAAALELAEFARDTWKGTPAAERVAITRRAIAAFAAREAQLAEELCWMMGRPIRYAPGEIRGFVERASYMADIAEEALADIRLPDKPGFTRLIRREPLGLALVIAPWNYPYLTAVNAVVPALLAGNCVLLKHSAQTPLCAERMTEAFAEAGLPEGVLQYLHLTHSDTEQLIQAEPVRHVAFTGSVEGGAMVERAAAGRFISCGLELGGKDPAYVRADADLGHAVETAIDGAFFNSGQSCCGIERIYVHTDLYDAFVEQAVELVGQYRLGRSDDPETTLGPLVRSEAAEFVRAQIREAVGQGARAHLDPAAFALDQPGSAYLAPQVLTDVHHGMRVMNEESFGPVVGIQKVRDDDEALALMNDSPYGLTAAIFSKDEAAALELADRVEAGTVFLNRCDYLDPALAWTGVKQSGRGCTLSRVGYEHLTRPKSFHFKNSL
ncbi:aldehyde dehydrogenase family protein [Pseudomonas sp. JS3066]|uniref:aldehyde dehydrogenase family protein n=1 Tax=unclassified Pseudomonas TaxID=196821 RepID=UPI00129D5A7F|nr:MULTISPECIES: aldehyde dehydrogenase family protein [unclassified Pseudomonas]MDH4652321.1 aldehyde dehydrogenase family protein [Pseudomonas sp. BN606]MRK24331.1 aldehyde dehydrogenase family protein [Pseudomonas sp. JG-B]WVK95601.1 aldehyde dehydrogenase family protein [Pseudomonas sp. JS3066]